jgi:hypothetical protein
MTVGRVQPSNHQFYEPTGLMSCLAQQMTSKCYNDEQKWTSFVRIPVIPEIISDPQRADFLLHPSTRVSE